MGTAPLGSLLLKFSIPAIIGMMVQAAYNVADRYFIGQIGTEEGALAIAGITVGFPFALFAMGFGMLVGIGGTAAFSIFLGQGKREQAEKVLGNSITLLVVILGIFSVLGLIWLKPLLSVFGASEAVLPYAFDYMWIVLAGSILNGIGFGVNNFIRADGSPKTAMVTMFIGALLNIALDPIFIFVFNWGVAGAAFATVLSQAISSIWVLSYFFSKRSHVKIKVKNLVPDGAIVGRILAIGVAPFAMQVAAGGINVLLNRQLVTYGGDSSIAAIGIIYSVALFFLMPIFGLNMGAGPIIGYNFGAKKYDRVQKAVSIAIVAATAVVTLAFVLVMFFGRFILERFNDTKAVLDIGENAARYFFLVYPFIGFQVVATGYFQSVGKPMESMLLSLSRQVLFLIPALFILPQFFGLDGVWFAIPVADALATLVTALLFWREMKMLKAGHPQGPEKGVEPRGASNLEEPSPEACCNDVDSINNEGKVL